MHSVLNDGAIEQQLDKWRRDNTAPLSVEFLQVIDVKPLVPKARQ